MNWLFSSFYFEWFNSFVVCITTRIESNHPQNWLSYWTSFFSIFSQNSLYAKNVNCESTLFDQVWSSICFSKGCHFIETDRISVILSIQNCSLTLCFMHYIRVLSSFFVRLTIVYCVAFSALPTANFSNSVGSEVIFFILFLIFSSLDAIH